MPKRTGMWKISSPSSTMPRIALLPPLVPLVDGRALAELADRIILLFFGVASGLRLAAEYGLVRRSLGSLQRAAQAGCATSYRYPPYRD